ncbi:MAG: SRPBCC domain-containing protein [Nitrososphaerota archaeon]|nr:SRPBCC domain-containing protein [Aigarchaeota archaeon]MDW8077047.1 SRPBCC domain-containing protein [Nitrososphaerota archaeon]
MIKISDKFVVKADVKDVWSVVSNMPEVVSCFPNVQKIETLSDGSVKVTFRVDISGAEDKSLTSYLSRITGKMDVKYTELNPMKSLKVNAKGSVAGAKVFVNLSVNLSSLADGSTQVAYDVEADAGMLAKLFSMGLIHKIIESNASAFIKKFKTMLEKSV